MGSFGREISGAADGYLLYDKKDVEDAYNINNVLKKLDAFTRQLVAETTA